MLERLSQDGRALDLFAGRTEALLEAVADRVLPGTWTQPGHNPAEDHR